MSEATENFVDAVVAPLEDDAELSLTARQQLGETLDPGVPESEVASASERVGRSAWKRWQKGWLIAVLLVSVPMVLLTVGKLRRSVNEVRGAINPIWTMAVQEPNAHPAWAQGMGTEARLILFGAEGAVTEVDRWRPLWESDRENPVYYQKFVMVQQNEEKRLPADFLEFAQSIDPGNGWYRVVVAAHEMDHLIKMGSIPRADREAGKAIPYEILDEDEFGKRIALLHEASAAPRLVSHHKDLVELQFKLMPRPRDFPELVRSYMIFADTTIGMSSMKSSRLIAAEAQRCQREGDRDAFLKLEKTWKRMVETQIEQSNTLVEALIAQAFMSGTLSSMRDAAIALEVNDEAWTDLETAIRERKEEISKAPLDEAVISQHGSMLASLSLPMVGRMIRGMDPLTREELLPSVRVDQAFLGRILCASGWQVVGMVVLVSWLAMFSIPKVTRVLGRRLQGIFRPVDWMWIMLGGLIAPLCLFLIFRYATPLGRLDWGPRLTLYAIPIGHFISLLLMWLVWPMILACWRMEKAGAVVRWTFGKRWFAGLVMAGPPVAMILLGMGVPMGTHSLILLGCATFLGVLCLVWLLFRPGCGSQGGFAGRVESAAHLYAVRPAWLGAMLGFALLIPFFHAEERRWMRRDTILQPTTSMTAYESRVTEHLKGELRDILEMHPLE
ncbi:hypothetical protein [Haloferula rosea]|uniref:Uncharacterized protein n=1 Tax=Haloferula rosea TaxID=490093 RepID=A0A934RAJ3_9BACT|nr:hypothetical protein [Haloferula rosea]MBK1825431.1 hypothetical protein [Haloferula rosea]